MAKKKSKQDKAPRLPFRERFEQNVQKSIAKGNKWAKKAEKSNKVGLYLGIGLIVIFYVAIIFGKQPWLAKTGALAFVSVFTAIWLLIFLKWTPAFKETKIIRGEKLIKWPVRTKAGHELRVRLLYISEGGSYLFFTVLLVVFFILFAWSILGIVISTILLFGKGQPTWAEMARFALSDGFAPLFFAAGTWAFFWLRNQQREKYLTNYARSKTTIEVSEHPLQIGREYEFWAEQQGNYPNCHLEFYMVMIKTECREVGSGKRSTVEEYRQECVNYLVEVMEDDADIRPESPLRHKFTVTLDAEDYVPSVWYKYSFSNHDKFDWVLRVILISNEDVLVEREFPLVMVE